MNIDKTDLINTWYLSYAFLDRQLTVTFFGVSQDAENLAQKIANQHKRCVCLLGLYDSYMQFFYPEERL